MSKTKRKLPASHDEFVALIERTNLERPDPKDVETLELLLEERPGLWRLVGDLARNVSEVLIQNMKPSEALAAGVRRGLKELKKDLEYPEAPMLEKLLIEQVLVCWVEFHHTQWRHSQIAQSQSATPIAAYWEKRLSASQRRYLRAIETLARVRKLTSRGPIQVNIGARQVNLAGV